MIRFKSISYKNFLATGNIPNKIQLDKNKTTLISGENGAGKSATLEAISFALYGKAIRNINKPQLINSITGKHLLVELEFSIGSKEYLIRRGMKPTIFEIHVDGKLLNQDSASRDYQEILEKQILKLNHKSFSQIVILSIANYTPFMNLTAAARREVIEDLLDIQIFSVMNSLLKDKINENKNDIQENEFAIRLIDNKIELQRKHLAEINKNTSDTIKKRKLEIKGHQRDNAIEQKAIKGYENQKTKLESALDKAKKENVKIIDLNARLKIVSSKISQIKKDISFLETTTTCPTCKQEIDASHKQQELDAKNRLFESARTAEIQLSKKIEGIDSNYKGKTEGVVSAISSFQQEISKLVNQITEKKTLVATKLHFISMFEKEIETLEKKITQDTEGNTILASYQIEKTALIENQKKIIRQRELYNYAAQLLKDGGIKTRIIKQYVPIMNKLINKYLAQMEFFVQFELDETFKETIKSRFRDEFTYQSFSQGEKLRIDLALLFCWRAIAKMRNSSSSNLLFMDEVLDSSLDVNGVDEFIKIIESLTTDTNTFIISHRTDAMLDKFEHHIQFKKVKNFSKMVEQ
jgi:DNA repair exonuclease SbcCD ATPase subunit